MTKTKLLFILLFVLLFLVPNSVVNAQSTVLGPGDVALVQFNSDSSYYSFVLLKPISPGTPINFTDRGWKYNDGINYSGETILYWSNITKDTIPAGTVITIFYGNTDFSDPLNLSSDGDQIFIFQGSYVNPTMIFGLNFDNQEWFGSSTNGNNTALPPSLDSTSSLLATGHTYVDNNLIITEYDNGIYKGITRGTPEELMAAIVDVNNWELSDGALTNTLPDFFDTSPTAISGVNFAADTKSNNKVTYLLVLPIFIALLFFTRKKHIQLS